MPPAYFDFGIPFASNDFFEGFHIAGILYFESLFFLKRGKRFAISFIKKEF
jgi:hypothetical protein